jgi:hypothetical protein
MSRTQSVYDDVSSYLKKHIEYNKLVALMHHAKEHNLVDAYHKYKVMVAKFRELALQKFKKARSASNKDNSNKASVISTSLIEQQKNALNLLKNKYNNLKIEANQQLLTGNKLFAQNLQERSSNLKAKITELQNEISKNVSKSSGPEAAIAAHLNSSEDNKIALNGSEPIYTTKLWNTSKGKGNNNCYSYAMNNFSADRPRKAVPGDRSGYNHDLDYKTCRKIKERLLQDNPDSIYPEKPENKCRPGFSKIMMVVGERDSMNSYGDFHFYKHHKDIEYEVKPDDTIEKIAAFLQTTPDVVIEAAGGSPLKPGRIIIFKDFRTISGDTLWSHKLGWATGALLTDGCGKIITDPRQSCRKFSTIDYTKYCGTYCIRNDIAKSS